MPVNEQRARLMGRMDGHFATDDVSSADREDWKALMRHILRMRDGLALVETTLRMERKFDRPFTEEMARKLEGYARFGPEEPKPPRDD